MGWGEREREVGEWRIRARDGGEREREVGEWRTRARDGENESER